MPEIPNVVSGEPVEADWGNDIRDRSVQKYADLTALNASQPLPILGELAWLTNPGYLVVCTAVGPSVWTPLLDRDQADGRFVEILGDTMVGNLTLPTLTATNVVEAGTRLDGPLRSYYSNQSGTVPIGTSETVVGRFTTPVSGRWQMWLVLQGNYSGFTGGNQMQCLIKIDGLQFDIAGQTIFAQWPSPGISSGALIIPMLWTSAFYSAGKVFEFTARLSLADATGSANATDFDYTAIRVDGVEQSALLQGVDVEGLWLP